MGFIEGSFGTRYSDFALGEAESYMLAIEPIVREQPLKLLRQGVWVKDLDNNHPSFERAVREELGVLYRVAKRLVRSAEEAEDLVQSTLIKAFRSWHQFDGRFLRSWLIRILRNEWLAGLRSAHRQVPTEELSDHMQDEYPLWNIIESNLNLEQILNHLDDLNENYRVAIQLCDVEQMSYEEAAAAMDVPVGTVRSRLFRARMELRKRLGGEQ